MEIPANTYKVEADPEVEGLARIVMDRLSKSDSVDVHASNSSGSYDGRIEAGRHVAEEAGRIFREAGYHVYIFCYDTGHFGYMTISKKPKDHSFRTKKL